MSVEGETASGWQGVADVLSASLAAGDDLGASVCVVVDGEPVVDVWGGHQDRARTLPWTRDTLACVYSSGKAILSALILREVSRGTLDYDAPVADTWPDFAAHGKDVTLAQALSHQSGVVGFAEEVPADIWLDWDRCCAALADEPPMWPPRHGQRLRPAELRLRDRRGAAARDGAELRPPPRRARPRRPLRPDSVRGDPRGPHDQAAPRAGPRRDHASDQDRVPGALVRAQGGQPPGLGRGGDPGVEHARDRAGARRGDAGLRERLRRGRGVGRRRGARGELGGAGQRARPRPAVRPVLGRGG